MNGGVLNLLVMSVLGKGGGSACYNLHLHLSTSSACHLEACTAHVWRLAKSDMMVRGGLLVPAGMCTPFHVPALTEHPGQLPRILTYAPSPPERWKLVFPIPC